MPLRENSGFVVGAPAFMRGKELTSALLETVSTRSCALALAKQLGETRFVSGHDFSRALNLENVEGFLTLRENSGFVVGAPAFMRGKERFSFSAPGNSLDSIMRFSAG